MSQTNRKEIKETFNEKGFFSLFVFFLVSVAVLASWWIWGNVGGSALFPTKNFSTSEKAGQFGDSFGALTAAFAGLSLIGVYYAIWLQRKELTAATKEFKQQNETLKLQRFENTFFQMLSQHNEMVRSFSHMVETYEYEGKRVIGYISEKLESKIESQVFAADDKWLISSDIISIIHDELYPECAQDLGVYYRSLYRILKHVDDKKIGDYKEYIEIVKSQLTDAELALLFWNGITQKGESFRTLIDEYKILDRLDIRGDIRGRYQWAYNGLGSQ